MSWIKDVHAEVKKLDVSKKNLRKFGLFVGAVFSLLAIWMVLTNRFPLLHTALGIVGASLMIMGLTVPAALKDIYKIWMGVAFAIGWVMSIVLLAILYFLFVTPIGYIARLSGKKFMDVEMGTLKDSYWVKRNRNKNINYEKMY